MEELKQQYLEQMEGKTKEEQIEYLEDCKWQIDLVDYWTPEQSKKYDIVVELLKELKK